METFPLPAAPPAAPPAPAGAPAAAAGNPPKAGKADKPAKPDKPALSPLVEAARAAVVPLLETQLAPTLTYHTLRHTATVAKEARALAAAAGLGAPDTEALLVAAWWHDTGYLDVYDGHEYRSMERAAAWLATQGVPAERIELVQSLIRATHRDEPAETELQKLLVDADMSNLAREDFQASAELLRTEWEVALGQAYSSEEWAELQLTFMRSHHYHSEAGQARYNKDFKANKKAQRKDLKKIGKKAKKRTEAQTGTFAEPKRGIETMFRTMYSNHMKLSDMADKKASMMISLNAVLLSVIITYLGAKSSALGPSFTRNPMLAVPMGILLLTSLGSVVTAILSAQPDVTSFKWLKKSPEIATNRRVNLLFFGNFTKLSLDNFQAGMRDLMREKDMLYTNMVTDVYYLGEVLARKYGLLRKSYSVFMVGLILTVLSFCIVLAYKS
ncbi:Pycsar system effector family protein [Hymenobacter nivis]|uniref:HD domain-containing protein n=1 Tax=Hymenobacter nivis TaxID=1850093 RepID=A0A502GVY6_9BACT|nr:Pycsar system effector family protein [Hymenobacter nivis]TPG65390.1 HD domain-containing protein [Hymenobacter nivis]